MKYRIVLTDGYTMNPGDLNYAPLIALGDTEIFEHSDHQELLKRSKDAHIIICNKTKITKEVIENATQLKCICVTATGYNNVDINTANKRNIAVCNVAGYSTTAVAQHVFAMMSAIQNKIIHHHKSVQNHTERCTDPY